MEQKKYIHTYFRVEAGYVWGKGMNPIAMKRFYDEIALQFFHARWKIEPACDSLVFYAIKGKTRLYVHPMELSGPCEEGLIDTVKEILSEGTTYKLCCVDTYDELLDLDGEALEREYEKFNEEADKAILEAFKKTPSYKTHYISCTLFDLSKRFFIKTLRETGEVRSTGDSADRYMRRRFEVLMKEGCFVSDGDKCAHTKRGAKA